MRVTFITPGFAADEDDWGQPAVRNLVAGLARRVDVRVLALHYPYRVGAYEVEGVRVHSLGGGNVRGRRRAGLLLRAVRWAGAEQRRRPADLLHGLWADEAGPVAVAAGRLSRVPALVSLLGGELVALPEIGYGGQLSRLGRRLLPSTLDRAARVTVGSALLERLAEPHVARERLVRLSLGVDTMLFQPGAERSARDGLALLSVGSLTPVKDHVTLLRAVKRVAERVPGVRLDVVGDGPLRSRLVGRAAALGVDARFHGAVPHQRLPEYYRAADLLVVSSRYESQTMVALEALACGCPVVATAVGVLPELPGVRVVPAGDEAALAAAIVAATGDASPGGLEAQYTLERAVEGLWAVYRQVLDA